MFEVLKNLWEGLNPSRKKKVWRVLIGIALFLGLILILTLIVPLLMFSFGKEEEVNNGNWAIWTTVTFLLAGGLLLSVWSKIPAIGKKFGGVMIFIGSLLAVATWIFGETGIEYRRQQAHAVAEGKSANDVPYSAEAQQKRLARERQEAELASAKKVAEAVTAERERLALEEVREGSKKPASTSACEIRYTDQLNCVKVKFSTNTVYDRTNLKDHCVVKDPAGAVKTTPLGGDQWRYEGRPGLTALFFDLPVGKSIGSFKCGG